MKLTPEQRIELHGFNNLTKSLSFNMYDICYTKTKEEREAYLEYIDEQYNAERLSKILHNVSDLIGAHVLNTAKQDYIPQGASVTMLVSEGPVVEVPTGTYEESPGPFTRIMLSCNWIRAILLFIHTLNFIRMKELVHSGLILMYQLVEKSLLLKALNYLIHSFDTDIITIDYRVRGFTQR